VALLAVVAGAQTPPPEKSFNLKHQQAETTSTTVKKAERKRYVPHIAAHQLEASLTLGFLDLNTNLIAYPQRIIYKRSNEFTYYGNVTLHGQSSFNPRVRLGYTLTRWLGVESEFGISVSEYSSTIKNPIGISNDINSSNTDENPTIGPYDAEQRSLISLQTGLDAICYPLNILHDRESRWHPFIIGGVGGQWLSMNSNYTDKAASNLNFSAGGGLRLIADNLISVRLEVMYNYSVVRFAPATKFLDLNGGTLIVPVDMLPSQGPPVQVTEYPKETLSALSWGLGFTAAF